MSSESVSFSRYMTENEEFEQGDGRAPPTAAGANNSAGRRRRRADSHRIWVISIGRKLKNLQQIAVQQIASSMTLKCPAARIILQREAGVRMFYVPDQPWLCVLPINHKLGRVPLMKVYLEGSNSPSIPKLTLDSSVFRHGHADRPGTEGGGSPLCLC